MKKLHAVILSILALLAFAPMAHAAPFVTAVGGTGTTTPSGILYGDNGATTHLNTVSIGSGLTFIGGILTAITGGSGTVTQVNTTYPVLGGPFTTTGTLSLAFGTTTSNTWAGSQIFTNPISVGNFSGLLGANNGLTYAIATSSPLNTSITGNAATVTTNANLSGAVTSSGSNVTSFGSQSAGVLGTPATGVLTMQSTSTLYGAAQNGKILGYSGGLLIPLATTTFSNGLTYSAGNVTLTSIANGNLLGFVGSGSGQPAAVATSTLYGVCTGGQVVGWSNTVGGLTCIATSTAISGVTSVTAAYPIVSSGGVTPNITFSGLGTTTPFTQGQLTFVVNGNTIESVATTTITGNNGLSGSFTTVNSGAPTNSIGLATINAGVLGSPVNGAVPTSQATSTLFGSATGGQVLAWNNGQPQWVASTSIAAGTNITISTAGSVTTINSTASGGSGQSPYSWTVSATAAGASFTTIQAALTKCGAVGGGSILLLDSVINDGTTVNTFKGSNCQIYGASGIGTTTINWTGATTLFKGDPSSGYTHDGLHGLLLQGDGNTASVAIDWSDMTHGNVTAIETNSVGTSLKLNAAAQDTFYNTFSQLDFNDNRKFCIDASSTEAVNANIFNDVFCGSPANAGGIEMDNGNGNHFSDIRLEPGSLTGTIGLSLFDNKMTDNGGVWNNEFDGFYVEANTTGVKIAVSTPGANGNGIKGNQISNFIDEANATIDWNVPSAPAAANTFINDMDSNFSDPITTFEQPFNIGTSTRLAAIGNDVYAAFAVSANNATADNEVVIANSSNRTDLTIKNTGALQLGTTTAGCLNTSSTGIVYAATCSSGGGGGISDPFTHAFTTLSATTSEMAIGTSTVSGRAQLTLSTTTTATGAGQLAIAAGAGAAQWQFRDTTGGELYLGPTNVAGTATTTSAVLNLTAGGKIGIGGENNSAANITIGPTDSDNAINSAFGFVATNPGGDSRVGAASGNFLTGITTGDGATYGALYAFNYNSSVAENLVLGQFGGNVEAGASTTPFAQLSVLSTGTNVAFAIATSSAAASRTPIFEIDQNEHQLTGGPNPSCGTGCTAVTGDDTNFLVTTGSGVTVVIVNFAKTWTNIAGKQVTPVCNSADESGGTTVSDASSTPTTVTMNLSASLTTKFLGVHCEASNNFTF